MSPACVTCQRKGKKGLGACDNWRRWKWHTKIVACSHYLGPESERHFKIFWGPHNNYQIKIKKRIAANNDGRQTRNRSD